MSGTPSTGDEDLLKRAVGGDAQAFAELYGRRRMDVFRFALHMTGSRSLAEDLTQEVFLTLINKISNYDPSRGTFPAYLFGIARKHLLRHFGRWRTDVLIQEQQEPVDHIPEQLIDRGDPLDSLTREEAVDSVRRAVLALPARYREAVVLCEFHEMSYEDAAAAVGCAVGTIRSRLHRARALLLRKLQQPLTGTAASSIRKPKGCIA